MKNPETLIDDYLHNSLDENGQAKLRAWLKQDPANMRHFTQELMFDEQIRAASHAREVVGTLAAAQPISPENVVPLPKSPRRKWPWLAAAAAAALVVISLSLFKTSTPPSPAPLATLDSRWVLSPTADADYRVIDPNRIALLNGELRFTSRQPASLVVETPGATATAQGTDFFIGTHAVAAHNPSQPSKQENNKEMKMKSMTRLLVLTGTVALTTHHGTVTAKEHEAATAVADQPPQKIVVESNSAFAFDLYRQLSKENPGKNLFFSPYSISTALAMTAEGARGETALEMGEVLGFPDGLRRMGSDGQQIPWQTSLIHTGFQTINDSLHRDPNDPKVAEVRAKIETLKTRLAEAREAKNAEQDRQKQFEISDAEQKLAGEINALSQTIDQFNLEVANALWGEKTYPFANAFKDTIARHYGTGAIIEADFIKDSENERLRINGWVEDKTKDRIKDLIPARALSGDTRLVLINAIYFKGDWATPFSESGTHDSDFLRADGSKITAPIMRSGELDDAHYGAFHGDGTFFQSPKMIDHQEKVQLYPGDDGFTIATLPYRGGELSMVLIAPMDPGGLDAVEAKLSPVNVSQWLGKLEQRPIYAKLPKFKLETTYTLGDADNPGTLQEMGMVSAFTPKADFSGLQASSSQEKLRISKVLHKAFLEVNEKGTEAAAATAVLFDKLSLPRVSPFTPTFSADRPFLMMIRHNATGTILFMGRVQDPS